MDGITADAIPGNKSQSCCDEQFADFRKVRYVFLSPQTLTARDWILISFLCSEFELPNVPEDYVHQNWEYGPCRDEGQACILFD